jgi:hypothetical protein
MGNLRHLAREGLATGFIVRTRLLSFIRIPSRVVTSLRTVHNTLITHLKIIRLFDSPVCMRCGAEEEFSAEV